ncbi:MAG: hypothetical protein H0U03_02600 [Actinobacteria bacterium]|nr:hypothetical protein [Actinomycetota bacterium]
MADRWRWPIWALVAYIPLSGIPILALYPDASVPVLLKDFAFVIPAYVLFGLSAYLRRSSITFSGAPTALFLALGVLVVLQALNPALPNRLVGAIGIKVWLFYVPLYFLGYHFVRNRRDLSRLLALAALTALLPALIGIGEAALFRAGQEAFVYRLYGDAAGPATQSFTALELPGGAVIRRVPSTFSSWTQYYAFLATMAALTYAWWRGSLGGTRRGPLGLAVWLVVLAAALLSGARVAFVFVPALIVLTLALERLPLRRAASPRIRTTFAVMLVPAVAVALAALLLGAGVRDIAGATLEKASSELTGTFAARFRDALEITWTGLGAGIDTIASRYAFSSPDQFAGVGGGWYESWWVKVVLELGIPGLLLVAALFGVILVNGVRQQLRLRDPKLSAISAAILAFLALTVLAGTGKPYLDYDPINVFFWLLAGVLAKIPRLEPSAAEAGDDPALR